MVVRPMQSPGGFRSFDTFNKLLDDGVRTKTTVGGIITILASLTAIILFISQTYLYFQLDVRHSFILSHSNPLSLVIPTAGGYGAYLAASPSAGDKIDITKHKQYGSKIYTDAISALANNRMTISVHITFPHVPCADLDFSHDGATHTNGKFAKFHGRNAFVRRVPTVYEYYRATTGCTAAEAAGKDRRVGVKTDNQMRMGCTVQGDITAPRIGGDLAFVLVHKRWQDAAMKLQTAMATMQRSEDHRDNSWLQLPGVYNTTYFIHDITFYDGSKPRSASSRKALFSTFSTNPLHDAVGTLDDGVGLAHTSLSVTLIPTRVKRFARSEEHMYQASVTKTVIGPINLVMSMNVPISPGLSIQYDFSPLAVHHVESRENVFVFLSSLVGIVGGVFVTVGLVSSCLVSSAAVVSKKVD